MSKSIEILEEIREKHKDDNGLLRRLAIVEKDIKALNIIKDKKVEVHWLSKCFDYGAAYGLRKYNAGVEGSLSDAKLTKEEYALLKEVLK